MEKMYKGNLVESRAHSIQYTSSCQSRQRPSGCDGRQIRLHNLFCDTLRRMCWTTMITALDFKLTALKTLALTPILEGTTFSHLASNGPVFPLVDSPLYIASVNAECWFIHFSQHSRFIVSLSVAPPPSSKSKLPTPTSPVIPFATRELCPRAGRLFCDRRDIVPNAVVDDKRLGREVEGIWRLTRRET